jgi:hypothetical protein
MHSAFMYSNFKHKQAHLTLPTEAYTVIINCLGEMAQKNLSSTSKQLNAGVNSWF